MENKPLKVVDNQILWFNGLKWLVKETCADNAAAVQRLEELTAQQNEKAGDSVL